MTTTRILRPKASNPEERPDLGYLNFMPTEKGDTRICTVVAQVTDFTLLLLLHMFLRFGFAFKSKAVRY